ncbi:MAG TPA: hypothetical protein VGH14_12955 [Solirubrobacterales bacterium]|jgi:hypothetical protein
MPERFAVLGLDLRVDFPLPGLEPVEVGDALPAVDVELASAARLEAAWSGTAAPGRWRGALGDGETFEIERGRGGDHLFHYGGRARFHLDAAGRALACCPADVADRGWLRALLTKVLPNVAIANGREALHAAAVADEGGAILVAGPSGGGKSSLALELVRRGRRFLADDIVVLERREGGIVAHPAGPFANLPAGQAALSPPHELLDPGPGKRWVAIAGAMTEPSPVAAVVLLERARGSLLGAWPIDPSPLALAPFMLGLPDDDGRDADRFALYADLVEDARLVRLTAGAGNGPADLAETLLRATSSSRPVAVEVAS